MIEINNILESEKYITDIEAVIFDLDDTLYPEKDYVKSGYRHVEKILHKSGLAEKMWKVFEQGGQAIDHVLQEENLLEMKELALSAYRLQKPDITLFEGVADMLQRLKKQGKKIGIITDGRPEGQRAKIAALQLKVDECIITDELGGIEYRKPNELAFRLMQERMQVPYEKMVYIGDNIKKDFIAPKRLGMRCIYVRFKDGLYYESITD